MEDLIEALKILKNYIDNDYNKEYPISCEHDIMYVCSIDLDQIKLDDIHKLAKLGFIPGSDDDAEYTTSIYDENGDYCGDVDFETISQEEWDGIKDNITNCFRSYKFGSC